jgi:chromosome partitioning protein
MGNEDAETAVVATANEFDLIPANGDLSGAQVELLDELGRELRLKTALATIRGKYDYILVDCPPSLNLLTVNALTAADTVIIPMQCEYFALEGLTDLINTIRKIREALNPNLRIEGLLRTMYDGRNTLSNEVSEQLQAHFGDKVYETIIPRNVRIAEAPSHGVPVYTYDATSKGAQAYLALAGELMQRERAA